MCATCLPGFKSLADGLFYNPKALFYRTPAEGTIWARITGPSESLDAGKHSVTARFHFRAMAVTLSDRLGHSLMGNRCGSVASTGGWMSRSCLRVEQPEGLISH